MILKIFILLFLSVSLFVDVFAKGIKQTANVSLEYDTNFEFYIHNLTTISNKKLKKLQNAYLTTYFRAWRLQKTTAKKTDVAYLINKKYSLYYEYKNTVPEFIWDYLQKEANVEQLGTIKKRAIVIKNTLIKALPTDSSFYKDDSLAGEGYPFDYNQLSNAYVNTPVLVSHLSLNKKWAFIENAYNVGWVKVNNIAYVDDNMANTLINNKEFKMSMKDNLTIMHNNMMINRVKLGTIFAVIDNKTTTAIKDSKTQNAKLIYIDDNEYLKKFPIDFNTTNIAMLIKELINEPYGWGGFRGRDCSSLTKDFLSSFGYPMQRNSNAQKQNGRYISLKHKSNKAKKKIIKKYGVPFLSLIYLKGHITLYVGIKNNEPMILHNLWAIRIKEDGKEARYKIGKSIISSLEVGKNIDGFIPAQSILSRAEGLIVLLR